MRPIIVYTTTDETVPAHLRFMAKFKDGAKLLPLMITGSTEDGVRATAEQWWRDEEARQQKVGTMRKPAGTVLLPAAPKAAPVPDLLASLLPR